MKSQSTLIEDKMPVNFKSKVLKSYYLNKKVVNTEVVNTEVVNTGWNMSFFTCYTKQEEYEVDNTLDLL